jgi:hypothetical protein
MSRSAGRDIIVTDSVTLLGKTAQGTVVVCGSHGGVIAGLFAAAAGVAGVVFNDAGTGKEQAGIAGLHLIEQYGIAAAAVDHQTARIGDGQDCIDTGIVSFVNHDAVEAGVKIGMSAAEAAERMAMQKAPSQALPPRPPSPAEREPLLLEDGCPRVLALDSVSQVGWNMAGSVILGGSHGGIVNGKAIKAPVRAAFFNDAGLGKDNAGISRLPALDVCGIPGATVSAMSARIGDGLDTYENGTISHVNATARALAIHVGQSAAEAVARIRQATLEAAPSETA